MSKTKQSTAVVSGAGVYITGSGRVAIINEVRQTLSGQVFVCHTFGPGRGKNGMRVLTWHENGECVDGKGESDRIVRKV